jgi:hypothetical protein
MLPYKVIKHKETRAAFIELCDDKIIRVRVKKGEEIDLNKQIELFDTYNEMMEGANYAFLFEPMDGLSTMNYEARRFATQNPDYYKKVCVGVVVQSLAQRILGNFYFRTLGPKIPYKMFATAAEAERWCHSILLKKTGIVNRIP